MIKFGRTNIYRVNLTLIQSVYDDGSLDRILTPIGNAIKHCEYNIDSAESINNEDYFDSILDYEVEIIENLLGTTFVACQTYITSMVSRIISVHKYHNKQNKLLTIGNTKSNILSLGDKPKNFKYTKVQFIDSFANYFKHRDEWKLSWDKEKGISANTIKIIKSVDLNSGSTGNLRKASEFLGNPEYKNTEVFYDIIFKWCKNLHNMYYSELKRLNLV